MQAAPFSITRRGLQARLAVTCGDGALVAGGPNSGHPSTGGLDKVWTELGRRTWSVWDWFHLLDNAGSRALKIETAAHFNTLCKDLERAFGLGQGRHVDRCVAQFVGVRFLACKSPCGTRKVVYLCGVPERFLEKFKTFYVGSLDRSRCA